MNILKLISFTVILSLSGSDTYTQTKTNSAAQPYKSYSSVELLEDFKILFKTLYEVHPDLYRVNTKQEVAKALEEFGSTLHEEKTYLEFLNGVARVLNKIGCINTQWGHSKEYIDFRNDSIPLFPLKFKIEDSSFVITGSYLAEDPVEIGSRIQKFNDEKVIDYLDKNYELLPMDGHIKTASERWLEAYFPNHHANFWDQPSEFTLEIEKADSTIDTIKVAAITKANFSTKSGNDKKRPLRFESKQNFSVLTIQSLSEATLKKSGLNFNTFLKESFQKIKKQNTQTLLIDLRGNGWGDLSYGGELMRYLMDTSFTFIDTIFQKKRSGITYPDHLVQKASEISSGIERYTKPIEPYANNFKGDLILLLDGWCVESKAFFASRITSEREVTVVGEESGGTTFGFNGNPLTLKLPNTGISVYIPTVQYLTDINKYKNIRGVKISENERRISEEMRSYLNELNP